MKQILLLAILATSSLAAKVPVDHVPVKMTTPVPVAVPVPVPVGVPVPVPVPATVEHHHQHEKGDEHIQPHHHVVPVPPSSVPSHVQHVVQQAHQHIQQVVNHHVVNQQHKVPQVVAPTKVPHVGGVQPVVVPVQKVSGVTAPVAVHHHHVHVDVVQHHADGQKHVAQNHHAAHVPQHVVDKIHKIEHHIEQVMHQAHQHIPQVINHQIAEKQKHHKVEPAAVGATPIVHHQHVHHVPEVTVKTTTM